MGLIIHDAIVVTAFRKSDAERARSFALAHLLPVTDVVASAINDYWSFLIGPDGSKEGWEDSNKGEAARNEWLEWARSGPLQRPPVHVEFVHVRYGETPARVATASGEYED